VPATGLASYPDVTVICGPVEADPDSPDTVVNPTVVVEVLSPSTIDYDLGEKFEHYRQIPSLRAVLYVSQDRRQIEVRERQQDGSWASTSADAGAAARIATIDCTIDVSRLYAEAGSQL
jgi:Uma2 family endonuclease